MKERALEMNMQPVAECAADNVGSQKTLEKAGFLQTHELLLFDGQK